MLMGTAAKRMLARLLVEGSQMQSRGHHSVAAQNSVAAFLLLELVGVQRSPGAEDSLLSALVFRLLCGHIARPGPK